MNIARRSLLALASTGALILSGCAVTAPAADPAVRQVLAPSGALRVGVYRGSPSSMVVDAKTGEKTGVTYQLGHALAKRMGVPVQIVEYERLALVVEAVRTGEVDLTFTNASPVRARVMNFTPVMLQVELGYLLPAQSPITSVADADKDGRRIGVTQGSSSQATLTRLYKNKVVLVPATSFKQAQEMLRRGEVEAFATNKGILSEMMDSMPGFRILPDSWGFESMAIAVPKGREAAMPYVEQFAREVQASGQLQSFVSHAGLRGTRKPQ